MSFGLFNSSLNKSGYVDAQFDALWGERATVQTWFDVEAALARVQAKLGIVPPEAAVEISEHARVTDAFMDAVSHGGVGNPLMVGLDAIRDAVPASARGWVHFGATSQDILDTGRALQIRDSLHVIVARARTVVLTLWELCQRYADTPMAVRTNGQLALPATLGTRFARWRTSIQRDITRIEASRGDAVTVQFSGAGGTYASNGEQGPVIARGLAEELHLTYRFIPWHAERDGILAMCTALAIHAQNLAKIAEDLFMMQMNDLGEATEAMDAHLSGSSAMPQKKNPFDTMKISVAARVCAANVATLLTAPVASFERDHRSLEVERDVVPHVFVALGGAQLKLLGLLEKLSFNTVALSKNAHQMGPLIVTEHILMVLAPHLGHEKAHDVLQEFAAEYRSRGTSLADFAAARPEIAAALEGVDLEELERPESYLGLSHQIALADPPAFDSPQAE